jgi:hypothetical protein
MKEQAAARHEQRTPVSLQASKQGRDAEGHVCLAAPLHLIHKKTHQALFQQSPKASSIQGCPLR